METKLMQQTCSWYLQTKGKVLQADAFLKKSTAIIQEGYKLITEPHILTLIMICPYIH
jgi:hypothetical protein